jgi:hypothetical protein
MTMRGVLLILPIAAASFAQPPAPATGQASAVIDITGNWVSVIDEDWRWRMMTPAKGDFTSVPLNAEGRKVVDAWDPAKDEAAGEQCRAYGAAGLMRMPMRLRIGWADAQTLRVQTDSGEQTRLFHFDGPKWRGGAAGWQGDSVATWKKQAQTRGFAPPFDGPAPGKGGALQVTTTHMRPGYLRRNGVPYSGDATLIEYFDRIDVEGAPFLILTTVVEDPRYLSEPFITSEQFKWEPDGSKWDPAPCRAK